MNNNNPVKIESTGKKAAREAAIHELTHGKAVYVMAFVVPLVIMIAIFAIRDIFPFGDKCYLRSDMYHQYCPFFSELWNKIRNGESLFYSWNIGMGTNFLAVYGYYLSSPTNWLVGLFPQKYMIEVMNVIILLKLAGASLTCTYYLCMHNKKRHISAAVFGLFYGLSAFIAAYSWNLMWLDCVLLLPLVVLGLEKLVHEGKGLMYAITLGLTILSNYYIAIMVCISMVIYFVVIMVSRPVPKDKNDYPRAILRFVGYSLLAGGLAAILLLPEVCALEYTASSNINFPKVMTRYFSFITIIKRHLINIDVSLGLDHLPNIYCGVAVLLLFPLYIINKRISCREKVAKVLALFIFFTAFNMNIPNFIWHGFHYPNSLPCRQSFIYIFLLLGICYDAFINMREYKTSHISGSLWGVLLFLIYLGNTLTDEDIDFSILYISAIFIGIYALIAMIARSKKVNVNYLMIGLFAVAIVECTINMDHTGYSTTTRSYYLSDLDKVETLLGKAEEIEGEDAFYRTTKYRGYRTKNDDTWHHFKGGSVFSSTAYASLTSFYDDLGLEHSTNAYALNGATPLIYSIFNVKYLLSNKEIKSDGIYSLVDEADGEYLYKNTYALPLGFMLPSGFNEEFDRINDANPFAVQNDLANAAAGVEELYTRISFEDNISSAIITPDKDCYLYMYIMNKNIETISVTIDGNSETFTGINHGRMIDLGYVNQGTSIHVTESGGDGSNNLQMYAYVLNTDKLEQFYNALADGGLTITKYSSTDVMGYVNAAEDGLLFTSIPYDESYTVYVDNVKTDYTSTGNGAFIAVRLPAGTHTVEFRYMPRGFKAGAVISVICLLLLIGCIVFRLKTKRELTQTETEEDVRVVSSRAADRAKDKTGAGPQAAVQPASQAAQAQKPAAPRPASQAATVQKPAAPQPASQAAQAQKTAAPRPVSQAATVQKPAAPQHASQAAQVQKPAAPQPASQAATTQKPAAPQYASQAAAQNVQTGSTGEKPSANTDKEEK